MKKSVYLFIPCITKAVFPYLEEKAIKLFEYLGYETIIPKDHTCCGQMAFNYGYIAEAKRLAKRTIEIFHKDIPVVFLSGSCAHTVKYNYYPLFRDDKLLSRVKNLSIRIYEWTQFIANSRKIKDIRLNIEGNVTYHDSCQLNRFMGVREEPRAIIKQDTNVSLIEMPSSDECCGFGGLFSIRFRELAIAIGEKKLKNAISTGATHLIINEMGCLTHLTRIAKRHSSSIKLLHLLEAIEWK